MDDHSEPVDPNARLYRRQVRHELSLRGDLAVDARDPKPGAECDLRDDADAGGDEPARQPRCSTVQRPRHSMQLTIDRKSFLDIMMGWLAGAAWRAHSRLVRRIGLAALDASG
jgi:hypothetical protein